MSFPDGVIDRHTERSRADRFGNYAAILVLGTFLLLALFGIFGGDPSSTQHVEAPAASLSVETPRTLRNGLFFETRVAIVAKRNLPAVSLGVTPSLWRDMTINTTEPQASEESFKNGRFVFQYGPLKAGDRLEIKFDGQINPPLFAGTRGEITLFDDDRELAALPLHVKVMP